MAGDTSLRPPPHPPNPSDKLSISQFPPLSSSLSPPALFHSGSTGTVASPWSSAKISAVTNTTAHQVQIVSPITDEVDTPRSSSTPRPQMSSTGSEDTTMQEAQASALHHSNLDTTPGDTVIQEPAKITLIPCTESLALLVMRL